MIEAPAPYLLVPGFSQTAEAWHDVVEELPPEAVARPLEVPGGMDFAATSLALAAGNSGIWAGYSLGGRLALGIALARPAHVRALMLVSTSPGIADPVERARRRQADEELAVWAETHDSAAFFDRWLAEPIFAGLDRSVARRHRLGSSTRIADQLRRLGQGTQEPLWDRLSDLKVPVAVVAGERDQKYVAIARKMVAALGSTARLHLVPEAGHALLQEQPAAVAQILQSI